MSGEAGIVPKDNYDRVDANNTTSALLGISAVFTGVATDLLQYAAVTLFVYADVDSATDGVTLQGSTDGTTWGQIDRSFTLDVSEDNGRIFHFFPKVRYYRIVYTNGTTGQATFNMQAILHTHAIGTTQGRFDSDIFLNSFAPNVRAVIAGETQAGGGGALINVKVTPSGAMVAEVGNGIDDPVPIRPVSDNSLALISPSLTGSLSMISGEYLHKFEVTNAFDRAGGSGILQQASVLNKASTFAPDLMLWVFGDDPTVTSAAGAALNISDTEMEKCQFIFPIRSGSFINATANIFGSAGQFGIMVKNEESTPGTSLWIVVSSLVTFTTVTDMFHYRIGVIPT